MNPISHDGAIPMARLFVGGHLDFLLLLAVASLFVIFCMTVWTLRSAHRERRRLFCPVRLRSVGVQFRLAPNGAREDVLRCSVFGRRPITCGKVCLRPTTAI